jgi:GNAT superfamily N-acetyltransferase
MSPDVRPLTADLWPALEDLFGRGGASNGCWCMYWLLGPRYRDRPRAQNARALREAATHGPAPGLLVLEGDRAVGWCRVGPRDELPWLDRARYLQRIDDAPVWSLPCFYVRRDSRRRGITSALVAAALEIAGRAGAPALEAYPVDTAVPGSTSNLFTGTVSTFEREGFVVVGRRAPARPIMRRDLRARSSAGVP